MHLISGRGSLKTANKACSVAYFENPIFATVGVSVCRGIHEVGGTSLPFTIPHCSLPLTAPHRSSLPRTGSIHPHRSSLLFLASNGYSWDSISASATSASNVSLSGRLKAGAYPRGCAPVDVRRCTLRTWILRSDTASSM